MSNGLQVVFSSVSIRGTPKPGARLNVSSRCCPPTLRHNRRSMHLTCLLTTQSGVPGSQQQDPQGFAGNAEPQAPLPSAGSERRLAHRRDRVHARVNLASRLPVPLWPPAPTDGAGAQEGEHPGHGRVGLHARAHSLRRRGNESWYFTWGAEGGGGGKPARTEDTTAEPCPHHRREPS